MSTAGKYAAGIYSVSQRTYKFYFKGVNRISGTRIDLLGWGLVSTGERWKNDIFYRKEDA